MNLELTPSEAAALGAAAIFAAVELSAPLPAAEQAISDRNKARAVAIIRTGTLSATELKNLGLRLIGESLTPRPAAPRSD